MSFIIYAYYIRYSSIILQGGQFTKTTRADGKIVVITGANTGIGKETVRELAKRGAHIYMVCRDLTKCEEAKREIIDETKNDRIYCRECDLASFESIRNFAEQLVLINKFFHNNFLKLIINNWLQIQKRTTTN